LRMRVIIYGKTEWEGHLTFPIHVLDDVTYLRRALVLRTPCRGKQQRRRGHVYKSVPLMPILGC